MTPHQGSPPDRPRLVRFGVFEFNLTTLELKRDGRAVSMQQQPALLLQYLVLRAGKIVTREELQNAVWPSGTHVEFDYGLNTAINRIRRALGDSAEEPRFIETVPRQGYRFVAPVEHLFPTPDPLPVVMEPCVEAATPQNRRRYKWTALYLLGPGLAIAVFLQWWNGAWERSGTWARDGQVLRYSITLPPNHDVLALAISPAGDQIIYQSKYGKTTMLFRRFLDSDQSRLIAGTEDVRGLFFSPDGSEVGFHTTAKLRVLGSSSVRDLLDLSEGVDAASWEEDGNIYFTSMRAGAHGIWRIAAKGGPVESVLKSRETSKGIEFVFGSQWLAGPNALLYSTALTPYDRNLQALFLSDKRTETVLPRAVGGQVLPTRHLLYYAGGNLMAVPFDRSRVRIAGSPVQMVSNVAARGWYGAMAGVSKNGTLVYKAEPEPERRTLAWLDRQGNATTLPIEQAAYEQAELSPDGGRVAIARLDLGRWTIGVLDLRTQQWTRVIETAAPRARAIWSPDGKSLVVSSAQQNGDFVNLYLVPIAAPQTMERLTEQPDFGQFPTSWSARANAILFEEGSHPATLSDIRVLPMDGRHQPAVFAASPGQDLDGTFSPDGRWVAYASERSNRLEVFVQAYPPTTPAVQVSTNGGRCPRWSHDGKRLVYAEPGTGVMEAIFKPEGHVGTPTRLFAADFVVTNDLWTCSYSMAADGRLLVIRRPPQIADQRAQIHVVARWFKELTQLAPN